MLHERHNWIFALAALLTVLLAACSEKSEPGVGLKAVTADLSFGIPPLPEEAFVEPPQVGQVDLQIQLPRTPGQTTASPAPLKCPEAPVTEFADEEAPIDAKGRPIEGVYDWKLDGRYTVQGVKLGLPPFEERAIERLTQDSVNRENYTFQHVQVVKGTSPPIILTSTFELNNTDPEANFNLTAVGRVESPRLRGLRLTRFEQRTTRETTVYAPSRPLLFLPLPVRVGTSFTSQESDPGSRITVSHSGKITGRIQIDACGELISAWLVDGEQTVTQGSTVVRRNYDYAVATQFGATIVFEHVEDPCQQTVNGECQPEPRLVYNTRIGSVGPRG